MVDVNLQNSTRVEVYPTENFFTYKARLSLLFECSYHFQKKQQPKVNWVWLKCNNYQNLMSNSIFKTNKLFRGKY